MTNKKTKKYLVIGGAGFIGSNLTNRLIELNHQVTVLDNLSTGKKENLNPKAKFIKADIREQKQINPYFKNVDGVFLLAALPKVQYSIDHPVETNRNNIEGIINVLVAGFKNKVKRIVYSSSCAVYGNNSDLPLKENLKPDPLSPYALQKYAGEEYCRLFSNLHNLETVSLRYFNVYGPGMDDQSAYSSVISIFLKRSKQNKSLPVTGDGTITRDYVHVSDVIQANILAMDSKKTGQGETINIGGGRNRSVNELAKMIGGKIEYITPRIEIHDSLADISLAKKLLGWQPTIKLEQGVKELIGH